jgi:hypothetical protein
MIATAQAELRTDKRRKSVSEYARNDAAVAGLELRELSAQELDAVAGGDCGLWSWLKKVAADIQDYGQRQLDEHRRTGGR